MTTDALRAGQIWICQEGKRPPYAVILTSDTRYTAIDTKDGKVFERGISHDLQQDMLIGHNDDPDEPDIWQLVYDPEPPPATIRTSVWERLMEDE
jgi:hypothetical protein